MGTLSRYLLLRATGRFALLLMVFLGIIAGGQIALAINKGVPPDALGPALLGMCLLAMPLALPLALTTAVLVTMGGLQRDGELRALAASGIAPASVAARSWLVFTPEFHIWFSMRVSQTSTSSPFL